MFKKGTVQQFPQFDFQQHQRPSGVTVVQIIYPNLPFKYLNTFSLGHLEERQASSWPWPACSSLKSRGISSSFSYNLKILISRRTGAYSIQRRAHFLSSLFAPLEDHCQAVVQMKCYNAHWIQCSICSLGDPWLWAELLLEAVFRVSSAPPPWQGSLSLPHYNDL